MFSVKQKREIADKVQQILRSTGHPELPQEEIEFELRVAGAEEWSWAIIRNNGAVKNPDVNTWNESQAAQTGGGTDFNEQAFEADVLKFYPNALLRKTPEGKYWMPVIDEYKQIWIAGSAQAVKVVKLCGGASREGARRVR